MPRKPNTKPADLPAIPAELPERFGSGPMTAEAINAATLALKKALIERALGGEMNHHLGYPPSTVKSATVTNQRNGTGDKTILTEDGPIRIEVPRDRAGSFAPLLILKHERRFKGFDDKIVAMYARGCQEHFRSDPPAGRGSTLEMIHRVTEHDGHHRNLTQGQLAVMAINLA